jgi:hypothetical protein
MSEIKKSQLFKKRQHSHSQRCALMSKMLNLTLKRDVDVRKGKMALLPCRQGINASHVYVVLLKTYKNEIFFKEYKYQQHNW